MHTDIRQIARRFFAEQDRLRGGPAADLCATGYTAHLSGRPSLDLAGRQGFAAMFYQAFPDLRHEVEVVIVEGGLAAVRFTLHGTQQGPLPGLPPTGRAAQITATAIMRFDGGRVAELWGEFDQLGMFQQLQASAVGQAEEVAGI